MKFSRGTRKVSALWSVCFIGVSALYKYRCESFFENSSGTNQTVHLIEVFALENAHFRKVLLYTKTNTLIKEETLVKEALKRLKIPKVVGINFQKKLSSSNETVASINFSE